MEKYTHSQKNSTPITISQIDESIFGILFFLLLIPKIYINWIYISELSLRNQTLEVVWLIWESTGAWLMIAGLYYLIVRIKNKNNSKWIKNIRIISWIIISSLFVLWSLGDSKINNWSNDEWDVKLETKEKSYNTQIKESTNISKQSKDNFINNKNGITDFTEEWIRLLELWRYQDAINLFDKAILEDNNNISAHLFKWISSARNNNHTWAIASFNQAIILDPNESSLFSHRWLSFYKLGKYTEAIVSIKEAVRLDPKDISNYRDLWNTLIQAWRKEEAIKIFEEGIDIDPHSSSAYFMKHVMLTLMWYHKEALIEINVGIMMFPKNSLFYVLKGTSQMHLKRYTEAIFSFDDALKLEPNNAQAIELKNKIIQLMNDWK